jgi:selenocysteine lyase/cysteine desulfurase
MLAPKSDFIGLDDATVYLASGGQPPLLKSHRDAFERFCFDKSRGTAGYTNHWQVGEHAKASLEVLTGLPARDHAFVGNASEGIARVISAVEWRPGDNVVVSDKEYASGRFALLRLGALGVEVRQVKSPGWAIDTDQLLEACDQNTRLLYLSQVTSLTGQRFDIASIAQALERDGVIFLVDASHALGVVPVNGHLADFTVSSCYKFLCATHMGVLAWNRDKQPSFEPGAVGWASATDASDGQSYDLNDDASRAQLGNPNHLDVYILEASLRYLLGFGIESISEHVRRLADRLYEGLCEIDVPVVTPASSSERAANIAFAHTDNASVVQEAAKVGIFLWDGDGRVRASVHLFNTDADIERYLGWLAENTLLIAGDTRLV